MTKFYARRVPKVPIIKEAKKSGDRDGEYLDEPIDPLPENCCFSLKYAMVLAKN